MKKTIGVAVVVLVAAAVIFTCYRRIGKNTTDPAQRETPGEVASPGAGWVGNPATGPILGQDSLTGAASGNTVLGETLLESRSCEYAKQIVGGLLSPVWENFTPELAGSLPMDRLQASWDGMVAGVSGYQGVESVEESEQNGYRIVLVALRYGQNQGRTMRFVYDDEERIAGIWFDAVTLSESGMSEQGAGNGAADSASGTAAAWSEEDVQVGRSPYALDGTLTLPVEKKPPVVILVADAAGSDLDGTVGAAQNAPLRDIAHGLADQGIASLRYNRRACQYPLEVTAEGSLYDTLFQDVWYAVDQMYNEKRVDRDRIYIAAMGKSADYLPAIVGKKPRRLAGAVMMAAKPVRVTEHYYAEKGKSITSDAAYFMEKNSTFPLLVLQGEADFETTMDDFEQWKELWKGRSHVTYHSYRKLNHYFMKASGKSDRTEYDAGRQVGSAVILDMARWVIAGAE